MGLGNNLGFKFKIIWYYFLRENLNFFIPRALIFPIFLSSINRLRQEQREGVNSQQFLRRALFTQEHRAGEEAGKGQRHSPRPAPELSVLSFVMKG